MNWRLILGGSLLLGAFAAGWFAHARKADSEALLIAKAAQAAQRAAAEEIKNIEVKNTTIYNKIVEHTYHDPVYQECKHTPDAYKSILDLFKE